LNVVAVSGGESATSKTLKLAAAAVERGGEVIDLSTLSADGLLGRAADDAVAAAVTKAASADVLVVATPIYRATYTGAVKAFFDRFAPGALRGTAVVLVATTAGIPDHFLSLDTGGRSLIASLEGTTVSQVVYALPADFLDGEPSPEVLDRLRSAIAEADAVASALA
jgi:FMN reductase